MKSGGRDSNDRTSVLTRKDPKEAQHLLPPANRKDVGLTCNLISQLLDTLCYSSTPGWCFLTAVKTEGQLGHT